jgi:hypothetical protein
MSPFKASCQMSPSTVVGVEVLKRCGFGWFFRALLGQVNRVSFTTPAGVELVHLIENNQSPRRAGEIRGRIDPVNRIDAAPSFWSRVLKSCRWAPVGIRSLVPSNASASSSTFSAEQSEQARWTA